MQFTLTIDLGDEMIDGADIVYALQDSFKGEAKLSLEPGVGGVLWTRTGATVGKWEVIEEGNPFLAPIWARPATDAAEPEEKESGFFQAGDPGCAYCEQLGHACIGHEHVEAAGKVRRYDGALNALEVSPNGDDYNEVVRIVEDPSYTPSEPKRSGR